jgi:uncharacterized membrane-anchored protein
MKQVAKLRPSFTLRFHDPQVHNLLRLIAMEEGVPMTEIAEEFIAQGVRHRAEGIEVRLTETVNLLRAYRLAGDRSARDQHAIEQIARAEADTPEPLPAKVISRMEARRLRSQIAERLAKGESVTSLG